MQTTIDESSLAEVVLEVLLGILAGNDREFPRYELFNLLFIRCMSDSSLSAI